MYCFGVLDDGGRDFRVRGAQLRIENMGSRAFKVEGEGAYLGFAGSGSFCEGDWGVD